MYYGGKSKLLQHLLTGSYKIIELNEFEATLAGVQYILKKKNMLYAILF